MGIRANRSLPQVVLLPAGTRATCANAAKERLDRKKPVSASLETELESQPQNMIINEVAKDACLPPDHRLSESQVCFLSAEAIIINFKAGPPPLDLSFWSFLTFLHHGIEKVERHLL